MARIHNFNAGPAALPLEVIEQAQAELPDYNGLGMSVMELSHRSKEFQAVADGAEAGLRRLMRIPDGYDVLFLQGGASLQFAMVPMNLRRPGKSADYIDTGSWANRALKEAQVTGAVNVAWSGKADNYTRIPKESELRLSPDAEYVHLCSNETIGGIRWTQFPSVSTPLVVDMSSDILSREIDIARFDMAYAGAQKNLGPSGLAVVIMKKELAARAPEDTPIFFRYSTHAKDKSLYNTPNTWAIYLLDLTCKWVEAKGGVAAMEQANDKKAAVLYGVLDASDFWRSPVEVESRSTMNVVWRLGSEELEARFVSEAKQAGMVGLKGHRSVGGIRASIYNAVTLESVEALAAFMKDFEKKNG
ncbi:MAG: 3-phosphoserine/phosphohydroxythreonine transaminase [Acidobacteriota bacterium]|jgi:phosphoserine aminotransferase|nr:3-phosphoserine/phosphohydroxythreonine transaminase [Acidobacteriota bacterium]